MLIDNPAYRDALSRLAAALADLDLALAYELLKEDGGVTLLHDLNVAITEQQPTLAAALRMLNA